MQVYRNFDEMAAANMNQSVQPSGNVAFNDTTLNRGRDAVVVHNWYGNGVQPTYDAFSQVMVRMFSNEIIDKFDDRSFDDPASWEWVKSDPADFGMDIGVTLKGEEHAESRKIEASFNTQTGVLSAGGTVLGTLPVNPVDAVIKAINQGNTRYVEVAEKVVWDFVNNNPEKFIGG